MSNQGEVVCVVPVEESIEPRAQAQLFGEGEEILYDRVCICGYIMMQERRSMHEQVPQRWIKSNTRHLCFVSRETPKRSLNLQCATPILPF